MMLRSKTAMAFVSAAGLGVVLIGMGWQGRPVAVPTPGRIVAENSEIAWRSPVGQPGRVPGPTKVQFRSTNSGGPRWGVARFRVSSPIPSGADDLTRSMTIRAVPRVNESARAPVTIRSPQS